MKELEQGEIVKIEGITHPILVVSKDYYNRLGQIIGCPIVKTNIKSAIYVYIETGIVSGTILCDQLKSLDMMYRGYSVLGKISIDERMLVADIIQGLFEYI